MTFFEIQIPSKSGCRDEVSGDFYYIISRKWGELAMISVVENNIVSCILYNDSQVSIIYLYFLVYMKVMEMKKC